MAELYPYILQGASKVSQALLNRGKPCMWLCTPVAGFGFRVLFVVTWPLFTQPGVVTQTAGTNTANAYANGLAGVLPCGLDVVMDNNVPTAVLPRRRLAAPRMLFSWCRRMSACFSRLRNREVFIRAEAPAASARQ